MGDQKEDESSPLNEIIKQVEELKKDVNYFLLNYLYLTHTHPH
jgi:hypothetical protein